MLGRRLHNERRAASGCPTQGEENNVDLFCFSDVLMNYRFVF
jgi:hypothetical protein